MYAAIIVSEVGWVGLCCLGGFTYKYVSVAHELNRRYIKNSLFLHFLQTKGYHLRGGIYRLNRKRVCYIHEKFTY